MEQLRKETENQCLACLVGIGSKTYCAPLISSLKYRRLRCDRALPVCDSCLKRGASASCSYQSRQPGSHRHWSSPHVAGEGVQSRLDRLEKLIVDTMTHVAPSKDSAPREAIQSVNDAGNVKASSSNWNDSVNNNEHMSEHSRELEVRSARDKIETPNANNVMHIDADHKNPLCVGEAHWVALLNEVRLVSSQCERLD